MEVTILPPEPKRSPPNAGMGRPKGSPNKMPAALRLTIMTALNLISGGDGGVSYLMAVAVEDPKTFVQLVGKCLPLEVKTDGGDVYFTTVNVGAEDIRDAANIYKQLLG